MEEQDQQPYACQICFSEYNSSKYIPKLLPCGHSFCLVCLKDIFNSQNKQIKCPFCKMTFGSFPDQIPSVYQMINKQNQSKQDKDQDDRKAIQKCPKHKLNQEVWCLKDSKEICIRCLLSGKHKNHESIDIQLYRSQNFQKKLELKQEENKFENE